MGLEHRRRLAMTATLNNGFEVVRALDVDREELVRGSAETSASYGAAASATSKSEARSSPASARTIGRSTAE